MTAGKSLKKSASKAAPAKASSAKKAPASTPASASGTLPAKTSKSSKAAPKAAKEPVSKVAAKKPASTAQKPAPTTPPAGAKKPAPKAPTTQSKEESKKAPPPPKTKNLPDPTVINPAPTLRPAPPGTKRMISAEIRKLEAQLIDDRDDLMQAVKTAHGNSLTQSEGVNTEEDGTELSSQLLTLNSASGIEERIRQIDEALKAIQQGTYGYCTVCGKLINPERLRALPSAKTCIVCQSAAEAQNSGRVYIPGRI